MPDVAETDPLELEWRASLAECPLDVRLGVRDLVTHLRAELCDRFYETLLADPEAAAYLDHDVVRARLRPGLERWLADLFAIDDDAALAAVMARQRQVAEIHARVHVPIHLVARGARSLERWLFAGIDAWFADRDRALAAVRHVRDQLGLAHEAMTAAFVRSSERGARADEAYRLFSVTQNIATERERQRAALLDWTQRSLFALGTPSGPGRVPPLGRSEFGLWLEHRAALVFEGAPELAAIREAVARVDDVISPQLAAASGDATRAPELLELLQREVEAAQFHLATLFDRYVQVDSGRDTLTRLLSRRFLPSVLAHEIEVHRRTLRDLCLLVIDVDAFKAVNDAHGHAAGDLVLQRLAQLVADAVRAGDYVIRYGGDELVVILVEATRAAAIQVAESIRARVAAQPMPVGPGDSVPVTVSVGVAAFDGHPDYEYLFTRADRALGEAKRAGRDRVAVAP